MITRQLHHLIFATVACAAVALGQSDGSFQVRYAANLTATLPGLIYSTNSTSSPGFDPNVGAASLEQDNSCNMGIASQFGYRLVTVNSGVTASLTLPLSALNTTTAKFELLTEVAGAPGVAIDSFNFTGITTTPALYTATSNTPAPVTANTAYWVRAVIPPCIPGTIVIVAWYAAAPPAPTNAWLNGAVLPSPPFYNSGAMALQGLVVRPDPVVNFTNTGANNAQDICVNTYTFAPDEQLISCCSCKVTRNALWSLRIGNDLTSNTLTPGVENSVVVKLLATAAPAGTTCNAANPGSPARGLAAWGTSWHFSLGNGPGAAGNNLNMSETPFTDATLSAEELGFMTSYCGFIQSTGSGYGICKTCRGTAGGFPVVVDPGQNRGLAGDKQ